MKCTKCEGIAVVNCCDHFCECEDDHTFLLCEDCARKECHCLVCGLREQSDNTIDESGYCEHCRELEYDAKLQDKYDDAEMTQE